MNVIEELLRMRHTYGRSQREIGGACGLSNGTANGLPQRSGLAGLRWPLPAGLAEDGLHERLYGYPSGRRGIQARSWHARRRGLKVCAWACLHAERPSRYLTFKRAELLRSLGKSRSALGRHLREMESAGVCDPESSLNQHRGSALTVRPACWLSLHSTIFRSACSTLGRRGATAGKK